MTFVCIDNGEEIWPYGLTIGKLYTIDYTLLPEKTNRMIFITDNSGGKNWYGLEYFKLLEDVREDKLKSLGL